MERLKVLLTKLRRPDVIIRLMGVLVLIVSAIIASLGYINQHSGRFQDSPLIKDFYANVSAELASLAITILVIDALNEWRQNRQLKEQLKRDLLSNVRDFAVRAVEELREHGWMDEVLVEVKGRLSQRKLSGADLSEANLCKANLRRADLSEANLIGTNLSGANLNGAKLTRADLSLADLSGASLGRETDLSDARLDGANLSEANMNRAKLRSADLSRANLSGAKLGRANLNGVIMGKANLSKADLGQAKLRRANLLASNLSEANFNGADLSGASLYRVNLSQTKLYQANLAGTDLSDVRNYTLEQLLKAKTLRGATMPDGRKYEEWIQDRKSQHVDEQVLVEIDNLLIENQDYEEE